MNSWSKLVVFTPPNEMMFTRTFRGAQYGVRVTRRMSRVLWRAYAAFHRALVHSTGNQTLSVFYDNLHGLIADVIRVTSRVPTKSLQEAYSEHAQIFESIERRGDSNAKTLIRTQIDRSATYLSVALENVAGPSSPSLPTGRKAAKLGARR